MPVNLEKFDSTGGFSIDKTTVVDELRNAKDLNTLEIKNSEYTDSKTTRYILRGLNTAVLALDPVGTQIPIDNSTLNFVTGHIIGVNPQGVVYSANGSIPGRGYVLTDWLLSMSQVNDKELSSITIPSPTESVCVPMVRIRSPVAGS